MTTKLFVLAAVAVTVTAQNAAPRREVRVTRTVRLESKATPSIEPSWPAKAELVARR
jgi:hypothetical protein